MDRRTVEVLPLESLEEMRSALEEVVSDEEEEDEARGSDSPPSSPPVSPRSAPAPLFPPLPPPLSSSSAASSPVSSSPTSSPLPPPRRAAPPSYASPAGATKMAPTSVLLSSEVAGEGRARRMTMAVDLNEYKAQLEQNDLQTKKTQQSIKGIRGLVSKKKKRFIDSKYDLDLAYITDRLIAMGFPSEGREGIIRNPMAKVQQFFEERHQNHYKIYNLCSERSYKTGSFRAPVAHFGFDDHNPPTLELLDAICKDVTEWLEFDARNVAALHCKAGKGRTGTVICAYLSCRYKDKGVTSQKALDFFAERRTHNKKGVTIASQIRWVHYYYRAKLENIDFYKSSPLFLSKIILHGAPNIDGKGGFDSHFVVTSKARDLEYASRSKFPSVRIAGPTEKFTFDVKQLVDKDVKLQFYKNDPKEKKEKLNRVFHVWFNTHFVEGPRLVFVLDDIDGIKKTRKDFPPTFQVEFVFESAEGK